METISETRVKSLHTDWTQVPVERIADGIERQMIVGDKIMVKKAP